MLSHIDQKVGPRVEKNLGRCDKWIPERVKQEARKVRNNKKATA